MVAACGLFLMDVLDVSFVRLAHNNLTFLKDMNEIKNVVR